MNSNRSRTLPVIRWLQAGAVATGVGAALVVVPGYAYAEDGVGGSSTASSSSAGERDSEAVSVRMQQAGASPRGVVREARAGRVAGAAAVTRPAAAAAVDAGTRRNSEVRVPRAAVARSAAVTAQPAAGPHDTTSAIAPVVAAAVAQAPAPAAVSGVTSSPRAAALVGDPVESIQAVINTGVNTVFDTLDRVLSIFPPNPITDFLSGTLLMVRRTLFDQLPTTQPVTYIQRANGQLEGSLNTADPTGEIPTYTVTGAPAHGGVQVNTDGTYIYTPDAGYTGPDSFIIEITDPGFNLVQPFSDRVETVTVTVQDSNFAYPRVFSFVALPIELTSYTWETGFFRYEGPVGVVLNPGDTWFANEGDPPPGAGDFFRYSAEFNYQAPGLDSTWQVQFFQAPRTSTAIATASWSDAELPNYPGYQIIGINDPGNPGGNIDDPNSSNVSVEVWLTDYL